MFGLEFFAIVIAAIVILYGGSRIAYRYSPTVAIGMVSTAAGFLWGLLGIFIGIPISLAMVWLSIAFFSRNGDSFLTESSDLAYYASPIIAVIGFLAGAFLTWNRAR